MITILFTILSALYDKGKRFKNHIPRFIFRAIIVILISLIEVKFLNKDNNFFLNFMQNTFIFYIIFDYLLNILERRKWNYVGNTAIHDIMWNKYLGGWIPQLIFKIILLITTITLSW